MEEKHTKTHKNEIEWEKRHWSTKRRFMLCRKIPRGRIIFMRYVALLRGINVGGKNKLSMAELKRAFEDDGLYEVSTYINSGNILFTYEECGIAKLQEKCRKIIWSSFKLDIPVAVFSAAEIIDAMAHAPFWWNTDRESKHNAIFVISPATAESVCAEMGDIKPEYEKVSYYGPVIFWTAPLKTFSHTRWSKVVGTRAYVCITIRNANTAIRLAELMK